MAEVWSTVRNFIYHVKVYRKPCLMSNCRQVQHSVRRTAKSHISCKSVFKIFLSKHAAGCNSLFKHFHNLHAGFFSKGNSASAYSRNSSVTRKTKTNRFCKTVHGICSEHSRAGPATRTSHHLHFAQLFLVNTTRGNSTNSLKHIS